MKQPSNGSNAYLKYAGLAFQIFATLAVGAYAGKYLDKKFMLPKPYITIGIVLVLFIGIIYQVFMDTNRKR